jgi:EpsI family protein
MMTRSTSRFALAALLILSAAIFLEAHSGSELFPSRAPLNSFPEKLGSWTGTDIPLQKDVLEILGPGDFLLRAYHNLDVPQPEVSLFLAYFPSQRAGDTIHSPQHCLPGAGWTPIENKRITLDLPGHAAFPVNRYLIARGDSRQLVFYWYWAHDRGLASEYWAKYYLIADSIKMNRSDGALVRLITPMLPGESADAAERRLLPFAGSLQPLLDTYIPR